MYVYIKSEPGLWTVGFYDPQGKWQSESDHDNQSDAAHRVVWLNGGKEPPDDPGPPGFYRTKTGRIAFRD